MSGGPAFGKAALIEESLEQLAETGQDPTPEVYARLFTRHPYMRPYFLRDTNGAIKGEMLSRTFSAILDFVGERRYADHMIGTEMITHEGYDVPREVFVTFFGVIRDTLREMLGDRWTADFDTAWNEMLAEIDSYAARVPRFDADSAYHRDLLARLKAEGMTV